MDYALYSLGHSLGWVGNLSTGLFLKLMTPRNAQSLSYCLSICTTFVFSALSGLDTQRVVLKNRAFVLPPAQANVSSFVCPLTSLLLVGRLL